MAGRRATVGTPVAEMRSMRVGHGCQRALSRSERGRDQVRRVLGDGVAEDRGVAHALPGQRPGGFPMGQEVVFLA